VHGELRVDALQVVLDGALADAQAQAMARLLMPVAASIATPRSRPLRPPFDATVTSRALASASFPTRGYNAQDT
jgi:hypothetical protein